MPGFWIYLLRKQGACLVSAFFVANIATANICNKLLSSQMHPETIADYGKHEIAQTIINLAIKMPQSDLDINDWFTSQKKTKSYFETFTQNFERILDLYQGISVFNQIKKVYLQNLIIRNPEYLLAAVYLQKYELLTKMLLVFEKSEDLILRDVFPGLEKIGFNTNSEIFKNVYRDFGSVSSTNTIVQYFNIVFYLLIRHAKDTFGDFYLSELKHQHINKFTERLQNLTSLLSIAFNVNDFKGVNKTRKTTLSILEKLLLASVVENNTVFFQILVKTLPVKDVLISSNFALLLFSRFQIDFTNFLSLANSIGKKKKQAAHELVSIEEVTSSQLTSNLLYGLRLINDFTETLKLKHPDLWAEIAINNQKEFVLLINSYQFKINAQFKRTELSEEHTKLMKDFYFESLEPIFQQLLERLNQ